MSQVIIKQCKDYDYKEVKAQIFNILEEGELGSLIKKNMNVLLKVNLLSKKKPEECVTTNPMIVKAVSEYVIQKGAVAIICDSPAGPFNENSLKGIYQATGMTKVAEETGAILNYNTSFKSKKITGAITLDKIDVINAVLDAHMVINLAKLKTHVMMTYTGAVKNLYGVIPGLTKAAYHMKLQEPKNFANHLIDINELVMPSFSIIDGVMAMEGDGPSNGIVREFGYILGSKDQYSLDLVASQMMGIPKSDIAVILELEKRELLDEANIKVSIENKDLEYYSFIEYLKELNIRPFIKPQVKSVDFVSDKLPKPLAKFLIEKSKSKPVFDRKKCIGCGHCVRNCPAKIIHLDSEKKAVVDLSKCISCFCCHEVCPKDAVEIKVPVIAKVLFREKVK